MNIYIQQSLIHSHTHAAFVNMKFPTVGIMKISKSKYEKMRELQTKKKIYYEKMYKSVLCMWVVAKVSITSQQKTTSTLVNKCGMVCIHTIHMCIYIYMSDYAWYL